jgi:eukaryotic-like serine/threonine-protein kinase
MLLHERLGAAERTALELHVDSCPRCPEVLASLDEAHRRRCRLSRERPAADPEPGPRPEFLSRLRQSPPSKPAAHLPEGPSAGALPEQLESYQVLDLLGSGATGFVYKAYDAALRRHVALKVLRPELAAREASRARFEREARAAAALRHDHVVGVLFTGTVPGSSLPYIAMEYVEGVALSDYLAAGRPLKPAEAVRLVRQVALGLQHAHDKGLVHRDIKPSNLMLETASGRVRITDFGLVRAACWDGGTDRTIITRTGVALGTPAYMSPEHILAPEAVDARSDLFSLGVVLYRLLTGRLPFDGTEGEILVQITTGQPSPPSAYTDGVPLALDTVTLTCLAREPERRYGSAAELIADLDRWRDGQAVVARPRGLLDRARHWRRHNPAAVVGWSVAAGCALTLVVLTAVGGAWQSRTESHLRDQAAATAAVRRENQLLAAEHARDRGLALCAQGDSANGLLWLAHALVTASPDADEFHQGCRTHLTAWLGRTTQLRARLAHGAEVYALAFSPDGRTMAVGGEGQDVRLWTAATGVAGGPSLPAPGTVCGLAFATDDRLFVADSRYSHMQVWKDLLRQPTLESQARLVELVGVDLRVSALSPNGHQVILGGADGMLRLWQVADKKKPRILCRPGPMSAVTCRPDGRAFLVGCTDGSVRQWDQETGEPLGPLCRHDQPITSVAYSPDGRTFLSASKDFTVRLWDARTGQPAGPALRHRDKVYTVAFSPDSLTVATGCKDHTARLWDLRTGQSLGPPLWHGGPVFAVTFSPDGRQLLTGGEDGEARLWDLPNKPDCAIRLHGPHHSSADRPAIYTLALVPDGESFLAGGHALPYRRWATETGKLMNEPGEQVSWLFALSRNGHLVATAVENGRIVRIRNRNDGKLTGIPLVHPERVVAQTFSLDGQTLLTGSEDRQARLWDVATGRLRGPALSHSSAVMAVAFSPDGRLALTGCWDGTAHVWDATESRVGGGPLRHRGPVLAVAFHPDGRTFLTAGRDGIICQWNTEGLRPHGEPLRHEGAVLAAVYSPDGRLVLTGSEDRTAQLWEAATGKPVGPPVPHADYVRAVAFSPDGRSMLTAGDGVTVRLAPVPTPVEGDIEDVVRSVQAATGLTLDADGLTHNLAAAAWSRLRRSAAGR